MRFKRLFWFLISIGIGIAIGLAYGWLVNPVNFGTSQARTLRADYKTDYALMVAETYQREKSVALAVHRLESIQSQGETSVTVMQQALLSANVLGYSQDDIAILTQLAQAVQTWTPSEGTP
jgi:hypothetical protein